jgi:CheY-like chemotaxis protein
MTWIARPRWWKALRSWHVDIAVSGAGFDAAGWDGLELLRHIRENALPVRVAVTTAASDQTLSAAKTLSPDFVLRKPFDFALLQQWLDAAA